jgi:hypothetical protein
MLDYIHKLAADRNRPVFSMLDYIHSGPPGIRRAGLHTQACG